MTTREQLDQLDQLRAAGSTGPWELDSNGCCVGRAGVRDESYFVTDRTTTNADAALIVASVNALPALTAALRAVLDLADELVREVEQDDSFSAGPNLRAATRIQAVVKASLSNTETRRADAKP